MGSSAARRARKAQEKNERRLATEPLVLDLRFDPRQLTFEGPIIVTDLTVTDTQREALQQAAQPVPANVRCRFLVDTGADGCVVRHEMAEKAGLKLIHENRPLHGVGVDTTGKAYMGRILFAGPSKAVKGAILHVAVDTEITGAKLDTDRFDGLIGRNVLRRFEMSYNGMTGRVHLRFLREES